MMNSNQNLSSLVSHRRYSQTEPHAVRTIPSVTVPLRMLRLPQVLDVTGLRKTLIYELEAAGDFPARVKLTANTVA